MSKRGAELVVDTLISEGVKHLFSLSGNQIMSIYDATIDREIEIFHTRHEAAAVHMADAWGRLTGQPGVALLTSGPGHCNGISALYVALMAESPVVLLSGSCPRSQLGMGAFQEIDQVTVARPVTKAAWMVEDPEGVEEAIAKALALAASGRPGPVYLSLPSDVLEGSANGTSASGADILKPEPISEDQIGDILTGLAEAERPLILGGPAMGRGKRWDGVARLAERTGVPALPTESPRGVNDPWLHGATNCLSEADVVLLIGKKLDFSLKFGKTPFFSNGCRFFQVDADQACKGTTLSVQADPVEAIGQLVQAAEGRAWTSGDWRKKVMDARTRVPDDWALLRTSSQQPIHPLRICHALQPFLDDGGVLVSDGGEVGQWIQAGLEANYRLINGPSGSIGSALPMGLGAKVAHPDRNVFSCMGDGTFGFHAMEFDTAVRYDLPVVVLVGNDAKWNAEYQIQVKTYGTDRTVGCELLPTRYDEVARALGGHGEFVERPEDLTPALERSVASGLPACVNIAIHGADAPMFRTD